MKTQVIFSASTKKYNSDQRIGITHSQAPVSVMLPKPMDTIVRAQKNRSQFIRNAIAEKIEREGLTVENPIANLPESNIDAKSFESSQK